MNNLAEVLVRCAELLGNPAAGPAHRGSARAVVLCLIDGLGAQQLGEFAAAAPTLAAMAPFAPVVGDSSDGARTVFPSTTATALASLGTGLDPGEHGLVGTSFWVSDIEQVLFPLKWGSEPNPIMIQPEPTLFEAMVRSGVDVISVGPESYRASGLTLAALRGGRYLGAESAQDRIRVVSKVLATSASTFVYCYWPRLDRVGHERGVGSPAWLMALGEVDAMIAGILAALGPDQDLVVTSDHGMINCPSERRVLIEDRPRLLAGVERILGDPRARHLYVRGGVDSKFTAAAESAATDVVQRWREELPDIAITATRTEAIEMGWFGRVDPMLADRIGDVVAVCGLDWMLASRSDPTVSRLVGQHGGLTPEEMLIPMLHARG